MNEKKPIEFFVNKIHCGDMSNVLKQIPDNSVDCIVTDPPYGYSFMGKDWDKAVPSVEAWRECLRILKDGAFMFVMSAPRQDVLSQMIIRLGMAGFDLGFTSLYWTYASGFPKAINISKAVDKKYGKEPIKLGFRRKLPDIRGDNYNQGKRQYGGDTVDTYYTEPATEQGKKLNGSYGGFQPKPAVEVIIVCMKLLSEKTYVDQALKRVDQEKQALDEIAQLVKKKYGEDIVWE